MSVNTWDAPIFRVEGTDQTINIAGTPSNYLARKPWAREVKLLCDTAWRFALAPKLLHCLYYSSSGGTYTDYVSTVTDGTTTHLPLDAMPSTDYVYLGTTDPVLGFYFDIGANPNAVVATLDMEYCSVAQTPTAAPTFADVSGDSDQTDSGGATLAIDGEYVWTLPAVVRSRLGSGNAARFGKCYWMRFKPSTTLSATVDIDNIIPIYRDATNLAYMAANVEYNIQLDVTRVGGWYAQCAAEKHLYITWIE